MEDTETALKSKRSVTDTDSSPGLQKKEEVKMNGKDRSNG